jgi:16S rRNA (guanine527-N7)-methyltransferase
LPADPAALLDRGLAALGLDPPAPARAGLLAYLALLAKWNRAYNLTAVRDPAQMVTRHLLDSLAVLPHLHGRRLVDVGSGAGLPAVPIALLRPDLAVTALDSSQKKTRFVTQAALELKLPHLTALAVRAEAYRPEVPFDTVIARAFASLADFVRAAGHLAAPGGRLLAMKGAYPSAELAALPAGWNVSAIHRIEVPGLDAERHLVELVRSA